MRLCNTERLSNLLVNFIDSRSRIRHLFQLNTSRQNCIAHLFCETKAYTCFEYNKSMRSWLASQFWHSTKVKSLDKKTDTRRDKNWNRRKKNWNCRKNTIQRKKLPSHWKQIILFEKKSLSFEIMISFLLNFSISFSLSLSLFSLYFSFSLSLALSFSLSPFFYHYGLISSQWKKFQNKQMKYLILFETVFFSIHTISISWINTRLITAESDAIALVSDWNFQWINAKNLNYQAINVKQKIRAPFSITCRKYKFVSNVTFFVIHSFHYLYTSSYEFCHVNWQIKSKHMKQLTDRFQIEFGCVFCVSLNSHEFNGNC